MTTARRSKKDNLKSKAVRDAIKEAKEAGTLRNPDGEIIEETEPNDAGLYDHTEHGEGALGMATHVKEMTQLQRMMFEDCVIDAEGRLLAPHVSYGKNVPKHLRPELIKGRLNCDFAEAVEIVGYWEVLNCTDKMVDNFIAKYGKMDIFDFKGMFKKYATAVIEVQGSATEEISIEDLKISRTVCERDETDGEWGIGFRSEPAIGYHPIGEGIPEESWFAKQAPWYQKKVNEIRKATLAELNAFAKELFNAKDRIQNAQRAVLWNVYKDAKRKAISAYTFTPAGKFILGLINRSRDLGKASQMLFKYGKGEITFADFPKIEQEELGVLWYVLKERKARLMKDNPFAKPADPQDLAKEFGVDPSANPF